jgi:hypothetical protein
MSQEHNLRRSAPAQANNPIPRRSKLAGSGTEVASRSMNSCSSQQVYVSVMLRRLRVRMDTRFYDNNALTTDEFSYNNFSGMKLAYINLAYAIRLLRGCIAQWPQSHKMPITRPVWNIRLPDESTSLRSNASLKCNTLANTAQIIGPEICWSWSIGHAIAGHSSEFPVIILVAYYCRGI